MSVTTLETKVQEMPVKTGVDRGDRKKLAELMGQILASSYVLYHKVHAFHWNVTGPLFYSVHNLTEDHYKDLAEAIDDIAERIRAIGFGAPTGLSKYLEESVVADVSDAPTAENMVLELAKDHQAIASQIRGAVLEAEKVDDVYTADLLTARIGAHEEAAWMLNAIAMK